MAIFISLFITACGVIFFEKKPAALTESITVQPVASQIMAEGAVASQNESTLHFQTAGKLASLRLKEGDPVKQGQVIASLDTYLLQKQLAAALNNYKTARSSFDQTKASQDKNVFQNQQKNTLDTAKSGLGGEDETSYINDIAKRIADQNQAALDNSVINVESANYAIQLSALTSPIDGVITHEDVTTSGVNITPTTSFVVSDPDSLVFKANVSQNDIDFVNEGSAVTIKIGSGRVLSGTVSKIYPQKVTLASGDKVYQVDIESGDLNTNSKLGQTGTAMIQSSANTSVILVPSWVVSGHDSIWVLANSKPELRKVRVGQTHGSNIEILEGLKPEDKIITNPQTIIRNSYIIL